MHDLRRLRGNWRKRLKAVLGGKPYLLSAEEALADLPAPFGTAARSYGRWRPPRWPSWPGRVGCMSRLAVGVIVGSLCLV